MKEATAGMLESQESEDQKEIVILCDKITILRGELLDSIRERDEAVIASGKMADELANAREEILCALNLMPHPIRVHEGGGHENLYASLALSVSSLVKELSKAKERIRQGLRPEDSRRES